MRRITRLMMFFITMYLITNNEVLPSPATLAFTQNTGEWETLARTNDTNDHALAATSDGSIYMIGGGYPTSGYGEYTTVKKYDPQTNTWTTVASMNEGRRGVAAATVNNKIYAIGGGPYGGSSETVEMFDPTLNSWTNVSPMFTSRSGHGACTFQGKIYVFGGSTPDGLSDTIEVYDPQSNQWSLSQDHLPEAIGLLSAVTAGDKIYIYSELYVYDPQNHQIGTMALPPSTGVLGAAVDQTLFCLSTELIDIITGSPVFHFYNLPGGPWQPNADPGANSTGVNHASGTMLGANGYVYAIGGWTIGSILMAERFDPLMKYDLAYPSLGQTVAGIITITGSAVRTDFENYQLFVKKASDPDSNYYLIYESTVPVLNDTLAIWDSTSVLDGQYTMRLTMVSGVFDKIITQGFIVNQNATGSLHVTINPQGAIDAGAQWRRVGTTTWLNNLYTENSILIGLHTVEFKDVSGYNKPSNQDVMINADQTTNTSGTYIQKQTGVSRSVWILY